MEFIVKGFVDAGQPKIKENREMDLRMTLITDIAELLSDGNEYTLQVKRTEENLGKFAWSMGTVTEVKYTAEVHKTNRKEKKNKRSILQTDEGRGLK